jgi:hypothetical protein
MGNVKKIFFPPQADHRAGRQCGKKSPAHLHLDINAQQGAIGVSIDEGIIYIPGLVNELMAGFGGRFPKARPKPGHIFFLDDQVDVRGVVVIDVLIIAEDAVRKFFAFQNTK